eukprot:TRINITY_DN10211_c0_g2_i1.p1 TRINITY_DN10211_c0_g2~~TRINITY_DN10211_c0_g2_i1.p1  ORF type:complete len:565 (-),score=139.92 TRINITY_DN10211_c0_g2_i1:56-1750(-)
MDAAVGIDFGSSYSRVGVYANKRVEVIANENGNRSTPSVVAWSGKERLVGDEARQQTERNVVNTVSDIKLLLGKEWNESTQNYVSKLPYKVVEKKGKVGVSVTFDEKEYDQTVEQVATLVIKKMKDTAASFSDKIRRAVVSVPIYTNEQYRQSLRESIEGTGLSVLRFIEEPVAVVLARLDSSAEKPPQNVIVFDLSGSGLTVTLLFISNALVSVTNFAREPSLSGYAFDTLLVDHFVNEFRRKSRKDIRDNRRSMIKLRTACEKTKRTLSNVAQAALEIDSLYEGMDFFTNITRSRFEDLASPLAKACLLPIEQVLKASSLTPQDISEVILCGGGSNIPLVQKTLGDLFGSSKLFTGLNAEEAVTIGATIQAAVLLGNLEEDEKIVAAINKREKKGVFEQPPVSLFVCPTDIGIATGDSMLVLIPFGTLLPTKKKLTFSTQQDNQESVLLQICEGKRNTQSKPTEGENKENSNNGESSSESDSSKSAESKTTGNKILANVVVSNLSSGARGTVKIVAIFEVNESGLRVSVGEKKKEKQVVNVPFSSESSGSSSKNTTSKNTES